jgi:ABC-type Mn2+/Zn2+ transport system permease subunit
MLEFTFMRLAVVASLAASVSLSLLGVYLSVRRVVFLGLVLANAAVVGGAIAQVLGWQPEMTSVLAAIATSLLLGALSAPRRISAESIMGWAYAAAASATVLILARAARADADTLHLLYGNVLAVSGTHATSLVLIALAIVAVHASCGQRFLLVTFQPEVAQVAGVKADGWLLGLNLSIGVAVAVAVHHIGALQTFSVLTLAPMASLLVTHSIRQTFILSVVIAITTAVVGLAGAFYLDLPPGPLSVALLALAVVGAAAAGFRTS